MQGDPTKDSLYYAVSEYERYLNPNVSESQVSQKASSARQNPEQYFAETYKKIKGTNIDEATINRVKETTGIQLDINKLKRTDVNHVDNDKRDLLNLGKELETINSQYGVDIEADEKELKDHFNKNIYNKLAQNSRTGILPDYNKTYEQYLSKQRTLKGKYDEASSKRDELYQKAKGDLKPVSVDKFFKDAEKLVKGDVATGNNAREVRQNAYLDSERYFGLLATDFQEKQSKISDPLEQQMASLILEGKKPEIPEGFQPTKEFKDWAKSFENLAEQKAQNVSVFGTEIGGRKMTYSEQLEEHRSIQEENRDENQNWFTKGKNKYSGKYNIPSITRTWVNGAVLKLAEGTGEILDPAYTSKLENEAKIALENNDYDKYLKVQKQLAVKDFTNAKGFQMDTGVRSDITAPVWERYVDVDGHRIAVDNKGNVQRVVTDKGFTVHNLSQAEKNAITKYQQNPKGFKVDEGFGKSWGKAVVNMAGTSAVEMIPMIVGGMASAPLRSFGMAGKAASAVVSSAPMFTNIYGQEFKQHFAETGDWAQSSTYATAMAGVESLAEWAGGITPARFTDALAGRPVKEVITAAGRRAADVATNARGIAGFSFAKEFVSQLAKDIGQEEAEEIFTMFAQNTIQNVYGKDSEIDMNEVLSTVLVTPLATAPFSVITNAANYRTPGAYRDMINSAADNFEKTEEIFSEIGAQMSQGKSESQKKKITDELKAKMDLISHVRDRKDFYAGNTAFQNIDFQPNELENIEHFIFEEALAKANGKDVDHSEKIKPIIAAAKKRGLLNAAKEEENPLVEDLDDPQNSGDIDFQENDFGDFSEEEWSDYVDNGNVTEERLYSIAEKVKAKDTLSDRERAVFANNTSKINNILKGVKEDTGNPYITSEEFVEPEVDVAAIERRKAEKQSNRLKKQEYLFNGKKDKDGFVTWNTVGIDGSYESISNDFEANNSDHRILFNVDHDSAQNLAVEAIDIARQTGIPIRIDISKADNVTDAPLRVSFRTPDDAKTFHNLMTQSRVYGSAVGLGSANEIGHRLDKKSQYSDKKIKSIEKARHIFDNAQSEDGVYYYNDNGDIVGFTDQEINELAELIDSPKKTWENAGSREFSETVEPIQSSPASRVGTDNRANAVNDSLRNPEQVETRETDKNGVQKIKGKTDLTLGAAFEFKPGERKEIEVYRKGKKGILSVNEGGQVTFEAGNTIEEVGNIEELKESTFGEKGFIIPNELAVNKKGQIVVGHRYFINPYSHAESAINLNEDGSIESVDVVERILFTGQLVKRVFTGQEAIDIATALVVNELKYNGDYKTFFENYTPTYEDTRLIPSNLTVDRIAQELLPHFNGNARMAMETAKMYSMVARNMHLKNPEQYPSPGQYIIDRVLRINNIEMEFQGLISYLEKMAQNPSLTQEEKEDLLYEVDRIKRINVEEEQKIQNSLNKNELIDEIQKLPLTHVRLDKTGNTGMGSQEMTGTYLSTEVGGNRYFNSMAIENGAELFDAKVDVKSPYDVEAKGEDIYVIMQLMLPLAVGKYIYEKALSPDLSDLLKNVQFLDDPILEAFPDFADYVAQEVTNSFIEQGYDSFYSRESNEREGYLVVFNKASVKLTPHDMKSMIPDENTETLEDLKSRNEEEYNALISGESAERRKSGVATQDGIVYKRAESLPGVTGNSGEMTFARNPMVVAKFKYKLVNIRNLHPSHIQGRLNPMHFIPEAQPKDRSGEDTAKAVNSFAFRPEVDKIILQPTSPYDAIPVVNTRGEVIQGNNRVEGIQLGYYSRNKTVRDYLLENLEQFGFTMEQAEEVGVDNLFIVREVNATDNYAIELGSYDVKDLETGGGRPIDPIAVSRRISFETKSSIFSVLFNNYENQTLNQLIRQNVKFLSDIIFPLINSATKNTITTNSVLNEDGIEGFEGIVQQFLFDGADPNTALLFAELPAVVQGGLMRSLPYIFSVGKQNSILPEVQKAILGFSDMRNKNMSFEDWATQIDMFNGGFANSQIYTPLEMKIIQIFSSAKTMNDIAGRPEVRKDKSSTPPENFFKYSMLARPKEVGLIFDDGIGGMGKAEAVMEVFKVPYNERIKKQTESRQEDVVENDQQGESQVGEVQDQNMESSVGGQQETTGEVEGISISDVQEEETPVDVESDYASIDDEFKAQIGSFGVSQNAIAPVYNVVKQIFGGLKSAGLTSVKNLADWVGIGKGERMADSLEGLDAIVNAVNEELPAPSGAVGVVEGQMDDNELMEIVGIDVFKAIQKAEGLLGEGVVDRKRMIETAKRVQRVDKKDKLLPEHIFEALHYEEGYFDNWQDLRSVIEKGGIDLNSGIVQRQLELGIDLPKDIVEEFKKSELYKSASPDFVKAVEQSLKETPQAGSGVIESKIPAWDKEFFRIKESNDPAAMQFFYDKVNTMLNGIAQSSGEEIVKAFEELKKDIEDYVSINTPKISPVNETDNRKQPINKVEDLQDVGEKIGGAKKDLAIRLGEVTENDLLSKPLSKIFPRPDYKDLVEEGGLSVEAAIYLNFIYDNIPTKPRNKFRLNRWIASVLSSMEMVQKILESRENGSSDIGELVEKAISLSPTLKRDYKLYSDTMKGLGFPFEPVNLKGYQIKKFDYTKKFNNETGEYEQNVEAYSIVSGYSIIKDFKTMDEAIEGLRQILNNTKDKSKDIKFSIYQDRTTKDFFIGKKGAIDVVRVVEGFKEVKEARAFLNGNQQHIEGLWDAMKAPEERRMANRPRVGVDWRAGDNITSEQFAFEFGFRGVEFGNWVNNAERQSHVNEAYDALRDLASVLGVSPKALSLNGELGFAFGARGSGRASAHYEPGKVVVNLTKTRGAGSLAHEWWHAMDNYFSRSRGEDSRFLTDSPVERYDNSGNRKEGVRPEMVTAFNDLMKSIRKTMLRKRSEVLDKTRSKPYWSTDVEMSARSFEGYVIGVLAERNQLNDYLANFKETSEWVTDTKGNIDALRNYPYLLDEEAPIVNEAFKQFFETIQEDEKGKLYKIIGEAGKQENGKLYKDAQAQYRIENGKNIIEAVKDFDGSPEATIALTHEIMHPTVVAIIDGAQSGNPVGAKHTKTIISEYNKANPKNKVTEAELIDGNDRFKQGETTDKYRAVQEFIVDSWEKYHQEGTTGFSKAFQEFLDMITEAFRSVYKSLSGETLSPELRRMFDEILGKEFTSEVKKKEMALGRGNGSPGDFVFNDSGQRYEIVSYDVNQQIYTISDENGNQYKVDPDMVIWTLQKNNIRNSVNHPDFNVSTVVSGDVNPEQRELGYAYKLDVIYPMNTFDAIKAKSYYFKEMPGQEGISGTIQSFLAEMEQNIQKKPVQSAVDERVIDSLARLKERKLAARENKKEEEIMSVRDLANKGDDYIEGAFFSSLEKGDVFTINKKVYEVVSKSKEKITKDESRKTPGKIVTYRGYSITIKPPQRKGVKASLNANIVGKVLNGSWFSNSPQWGSLSRDISGEILTDLINERNPFHEKSGIYEKIQNYIDKVNQAPNNEGIQMGFEFPSSKEQEVDISPDVELELYQDSEVFKGKDIREMVVEMGSDQGGISDFTADRIEEYDYVVETIKISDLLQADEGLKEYIDNSNKVRKFKGLGFQMHPIVDIKGEVVDGYNRIHQRVIDGDQEVTVYKAIPKVDAEQEMQEDVVVDENNLPENNSEQINNILSFVNENQELVDEFFLQKGIDLSELITFTDENGNPC